MVPSAPRGHEFASMGSETRGWPRLAPFPNETVPMAKPNYSFEKRQREIAKKKKQDEKNAKKQAAKEAANPPAPGAARERPDGE